MDGRGRWVQDRLGTFRKMSAFNSSICCLNLGTTSLSKSCGDQETQGNVSRGAVRGSWPGHTQGRTASSAFASSFSDAMGRLMKKHVRRLGWGGGGWRGCGHEACVWS